ncbi:MAG TPA: RhuM family protein [Paludibacter sp.]
MKSKNEIVIYQTDELTKVEVQIDNETVWLSQEQMASLFGRNRVAITQHIGNIFKEGELLKEVVCKDFLLTSHHGAIKGKNQLNKIKLYNLDVIISVGYRVKSKQGTQFRIWANQVLKDYLLKGYSVNNRMNRIEDDLQTLNEKVGRIDLQINTALPPVQGIFFNGQIFDAYTFVADIVRSAKKSIDLIDNYVDDSVLVLLQKRAMGVSACIYTQNIGKQLKLDIEKYNAQYPSIEIKQFKKSHDRFFIIDNTEVYHIGASIKDLGKKWFAFTKIESFVQVIVSKLKGGDNEGL